MIKELHKYTLDTNRLYQAVPMSKGAQVLKAGNQRGRLVVWVLEELSSVKEEMHFAILPTGCQVDAQVPLQYIDTVLFDEGAFVLHVFTKL